MEFNQLSNTRRGIGAFLLLLSTRNLRAVLQHTSTPPSTLGSSLLRAICILVQCVLFVCVRYTLVAVVCEDVPAVRSSCSITGVDSTAVRRNVLPAHRQNTCSNSACFGSLSDRSSG
eukprot:GHUV01039376.1.p1 GENE.GHUV01039376.1~~GHUV01039376.1.p1  ORF type:complete len:117 (+),score=3.33 GHUV01039376.1:184-534(+)